MVRLFNRKVRLSIIEPTKKANNLTVVIENLDISFVVLKENDYKKNPNSADITIFNLNSDTRKFLSKEGRLGSTVKGTRIVLEAGYEDTMEVIFVGDVIRASSKNDGTDWVTEIEALDSAGRLRTSRVNNTYKAGVAKSAVVKDLLVNLKLELGNSFSVADTIPGVFSNGKAIKGKTVTELNKILSDHNFELSFQNRVVQIVEKGGVYPGKAVFLSKETGMIGSPELGTPGKNNKNPTIVVTSLLQPSIIPSSTVIVQSKELVGSEEKLELRVIQVTHTGDTSGVDWSTEIECTKR